MRNTTIVIFILAAVGLGAVGVPQSAGGTQTQPLSVESEALVPGYSELRAGYGFDGNPERVRELLRDAAAAQRAQEVGMPLTSEEFDEFVRRQAFGVEIDEVVDWARQQSGYASERIAHDRGGGLILYGTSDFDFASMPSRFGALDYPIYFELVQYDLASLETAAEDLTEMMRAGELSGVHAVSIDVAENSVVAEVDVARPDAFVLAGRTGSPSLLAERVNVDVAVEYTEAAFPTACNARNDCWSPDFKAGILLRMKAPGTGGARCTMGFHVRVNGTNDEQFLMAGHCVEDASEPFDRAYHETYNGYPSDPGRVGKLKATKYNTVTGGYDLARWQMKDGRKSNDIYGSAANHQVVGYRYPYVNDYVCASLGRTDTIDCGIVDDNWKKYSLAGVCAKPACSLVGASVTGIAIDVGDSGSPIYYPYWEFGQPWAYATGIVSAKNGASKVTFARVWDAVKPAILNVSIYTG